MDHQRRKLIFLWPYIEWGGAQVYCMAIMKLAREDWDVTVIMPRSSPTDLIAMVEKLGVRVEHIESAMDLKPAVGIARKIERQKARIKTEIESYRALRRYDPRRSIFHVDFAPWQSWIFYLLLSFRGANTFVTLHNSLHDLPRWREKLFRWRMQFVSRLSGFHILPSNHDTRNKLKDWVAPELWRKMPVTYTCVDRLAVDSIEAEGIDRDALREIFDIQSGKFVVLTVGQFVDRKGRWTLLDAAKCAIEKDDDIVFVWVTPTLPATADTERVISYGLGDRFRLIQSSLIGERLDVLRFFKIADCFALPSFVEGLPIAVLEAMALGVPTISTNVFAIPEAVKHGETGLLVAAGDCDELCDAILRLKYDTKLASALAVRGREFVKEHFDEREASRIAIMAFEECFAKR